MDDGHYRTSDLYYAAYLKVAGVPFLETEREGRKVIFVFDQGGDSQTIRDLKREYFNRKAQVSALDLVQEIRVMKTLTHM